MSDRRPRFRALLVAAALLLAAPGARSADLDGDGRVSFSDFLVFVASYGRSAADPGYLAAGDLDGDGRFSFPDFLILAAAFQSPLGPGSAQADDTVVLPKETESELLNPDRGWVTFNGSNSKFDADPVGTTSYYRYYWKDLEPRRGVITTADLETSIDQAEEDGQRFGFRVMTVDPNGRGLPDWILEARYSIPHVVGLHREQPGRDYVIPDFNDATLLDEVDRFARALAERLSESGRLDNIAFVDIGIVGIHGEWYLNWNDSPTKWDYLPNQASTRRIIDAVRLAFPDAHTFLSLGAKNSGVEDERTNALTYARDAGVGWRQDAWITPGHPAFPWFADFQGVIDTYVPDLWKTAPAMLESAFIMRDWGTESIPMTEAEFEEAVDWVIENHVSLLDDTGNAVPDWIRQTDAWRRLITRMGYRLVLRRMAHPAAASAGDTAAVQTTWENVGCAPPYRDWRVATRLSSADTTVIDVTSTSVRGWLPSDELAETGHGRYVSRVLDLPLPAGLEPGTYDLSIGIVDSASARPAVLLAVEGADANGWYPLSDITIEAP